jgi:ubiquitin carboxyl-terminal hydrolase 5/13
LLKPHSLQRLIDQDGNPERAIEWLFSNPDDPGEEASASASAHLISNPTESTSQPDVGGSASLPAKYRLKAFISHKGPSVHSGHYVATVRQPQSGLQDEKESEDEWVLFNDEKVVRAPKAGGEEMRSLAYLYVYERV